MTLIHDNTLKQFPSSASSSFYSDAIRLLACCVYHEEVNKEKHALHYSLPLPLLWNWIWNGLLFSCYRGIFHLMHSLPEGLFLKMCLKLHFSNKQAIVNPRMHIFCQSLWNQKPPFPPTFLGTTRNLLCWVKRIPGILCGRFFSTHPKDKFLELFTNLHQRMS